MFLVTRRWLLTSLFVLAASALMVRLGFWQLGRLAGKRALIANTVAVMNADPLVISGAEVDLDARALRHHPATVSGEYDFEHEILLKNQSYQGQMGYHILTPLRITGSERAVLVDRGWIPLLGSDAAQLASYREPGVTQVHGRIEPGDRRPEAAVLPEVPTLEWYRIDIEGIQNQVPYSLLPFYIALTPDEGYTGPPYRDPPDIVLDEGPHLGYAIQWFLFAIIVPIVYAVQVRRIEKKEEEEGKSAT